MGGIFSRKVQNSKDVLEALEKEIISKTNSRQRNQQYERSFVSYLLLLSFGVYLGGVAVLYLYFKPSTWVEWLGYLTPLFLFPLVIYFIKKLLNLYFSHRKAQFDQQLATLHEEKRKILNEVMEKETYKTAIEILQQFEPTHPSLQTTSTPRPSAQNQQQTSARRRRPDSRNHPAPQTPHPSFLHQQQSTPTTSSVLQTPSATTPARTPMAPEISQPFIPPGMCLGAPPGPPTPCPILPRDRSTVDKMVEYLVGDGPNNRYALICQKCHSHNGMALRDEFEYTSFRCAYCFHLNPARKKKPSLRTPSIDKPAASLRTPSIDKPAAVEGETTPVKGEVENDKETATSSTP